MRLLCLRALLSLSASLAWQHVLAQTTIPQCPAEINTSQSVQDPPAGWTASSEQTRHPLVSIRFSDGNPSDIAWLMPDKSTRSGLQEWAFLRSERGYWVTCGYGNTSTLLSRRLHDKFTSCRVWLNKSFSPPIATNFECR